MKLLHLVVMAALAASASARAETAAPADPAGASSADAAQSDATQAVIAKLNAYVGLLNRTLRASESLSRYESWVNMKSGPTGKERIVYGLYSLYDVRDEIEKAKAAIPEAPAMPELDAAMPGYIAAYEALAPIVAEADGYYERQDYKDDRFAEAKKIHARLAPAGAAFKAERAKVEALFAVEKAKGDLAELSAIEQAQGRKARWHVSNVMIRARQVMDLLPSNEKPVVAMPAFEAAVLAYAGAVKEMDAYGAANSNSFFVFESQPRSLLGKLREFRDKLQKAKGDARRGAGRDLTWIVNDYNMMVSTSQSATQFAK